jgi:hypothetical protein
MPVPDGLVPSAPLSKLGLKQGRLNPVLWLTVTTLSFLPAGYFFKDTWLRYLLVGLPVFAFAFTLGIAWYWAIWKPNMLLSEDYEILDKLATMALTKDGAIPAGDPVVNPDANKSKPEAEQVPVEETNDAH